MERSGAWRFKGESQTYFMYHDFMRCYQLHNLFEYLSRIGGSFVFGGCRSFFCFLFFLVQGELGRSCAIQMSCAMPQVGAKYAHVMQPQNGMLKPIDQNPGQVEPPKLSGCWYK